MRKQEYDEKKIRLMTEAGKICSEIMHEVQDNIKEGVEFIDLDQIAEKGCKKHDVIPAFKDYEGFPSSICIGIDDHVVHGVADNTPIMNGDVVSVDFGIIYKGVFSDMSITKILGDVPEETKKFVNIVKQSCLDGIAQAKPGNHVGDIGYAMQKRVEDAGYSVVKEMVGHGIGYELHEDPYVPGYGKKGDGMELYRGQTLAIEAIMNQGSPDIYISSDDGWTTYTEDGMLSALFEHTIVVDEKPQILTEW